MDCLLINTSCIFSSWNVAYSPWQLILRRPSHQEPVVGKFSFCPWSCTTQSLEPSLGVKWKKIQTTDSWWKGCLNIKSQTLPRRIRRCIYELPNKFDDVQLLIKPAINSPLVNGGWGREKGHDNRGLSMRGPHLGILSLFLYTYRRLVQESTSQW
jgi:hypothetical protein